MSEDEVQIEKRDGLYPGGKFEVFRLDGTDGPGDKHDGCWYYVLDGTHDKYARQALMAYANACSDDLPQLAADLRAKYHELTDAD